MMKRGRGRRMEIDRTVIKGAKRCSRCGKAKPLEQFYRAADHRDGHRSDCKVCNRIAAAERMRGRRRWQTPEQVREASRKFRATPRGQEYYRDYRRSAWGRLKHCKHQAAYQLRGSTRPAECRRLEKLIRQYDAELARMEARR